MLSAMDAVKRKEQESARATRPECDPKKRPMSRFERITVWLTAAIFTATTASAVIFYFQWKEMESASTQTAQIIKKSGEQVGATQGLSRETKRLADLAVDADRPWVGLTDFIPKSLEPDTSTPTAVRIINSGKRPAVITLAEFSIYKYKVFPEHPAYGKALTKPSRVLLVPGATVEFGYPVIIPRQVLADALSKRETLYVYGHIEYIDVRTKESHTTHMCVSYVPPTKTFIHCPTYNDGN
jgi:hypothetical protein